MLRKVVYRQTLSLWHTIQIGAIEQNFPVGLFMIMLYKWVLTF